MAERVSLPTVLESLNQHSLVHHEEALETLLVYVTNLLKFPDQPRYRKIRMSNIHFQERLGHLQNCDDFMRAIGFLPTEDDFYVHQDPDDLTTPEAAKELTSFENILNARLTKIREDFQRFPVRHPDDHVYKAVAGAACHNDIGRRQTNEDDEIIVDCFCGDDDAAFFGLYDGHGGRQTVDFVVRSLHATLELMLKKQPNLDICDAMRSVYVETDGQVRRHNILQSGTTAVTVVTRRLGDTFALYVANVGDSRAVICRDGKAIRLTIDHKPTLEEEKRRITEAGGFVGQGRVNGVLAISRALGDHTLKSHDVVTVVPYLFKAEATKKDPYLLLACNGLWDEMSDQQAMDFLHDRIAELERDAPDVPLNERLQRVCKALVKEALDKGSTDNVTVMICKLA